MIPVTNAGPMTILMLYMVVSIGVLTGAAVGYHADAPAEATMQFDRESDELTIGNQTVDIYNESGSNVTLGASTTGRAEPDDSTLLSERGERYLGPDSEPPVEMNDSRIERWTPDAVTQFSRDSVNATVAFGMETMALAGDQTAEVTYQYQDRVSWTTVYLTVSALVWSPIVGALYYFYRKVTG